MCNTRLRMTMLKLVKKILFKAGRVVVEKGDESIIVSDKCLMPSTKITSGIFDFIIGKTKTYKIPIAICGQVLAYPNEDRNSYLIGDAVCFGPNGIVSRMIREETINYPNVLLTLFQRYQIMKFGDRKIY